MGTPGAGMSLAPGPDGKRDGSYQFSGQDDSYIEFPNEYKGLKVKCSITMLCWVYLETSGVSGPLFSYNSPWGVHLCIYDGALYTYFNKTELIAPNQLEPNQWHYVGSSYDYNTGDASLWLNGTKVEEQDIGAGINLATEENVRMGVTATSTGKDLRDELLPCSFITLF